MCLNTHQHQGNAAQRVLYATRSTIPRGIEKTSDKLCYSLYYAVLKGGALYILGGDTNCKNR